MPTSKHDPSERTLLNCLQANSLLRTAALLSVVWKTPYLVRYTHSVGAREERRRADADGHWREMYWKRRRLDREALVLVDAIRTQRVGRHALARRLVQEYGFDVWDALREEAGLAGPAWVLSNAYPPDVAGGGGVVNALPRRYWARVVLGVIARHDVMGLWTKTVVPGQQEVDFETALMGLSTFFDVSMQEVSSP